MEIWKPIEGFEGFYEVSNLGRVRSIAVRRSIWGKIHVIHREHLMKPTDNGSGYLMVQLKNNGERKPVGVHRLVAGAFIENPNKFAVVNHIDFNTHNNSVENLEWCDQKHNINHSIERMKKPKSKCKPTNTGEKYIHENNNRFRLNIRWLGVSRTYKTLQEAVEARDKLTKEGI